MGEGEEREEGEVEVQRYKVVREPVEEGGQARRR